MRFETVELSVLQVYKMSIQLLAGCAEHYYLSETPGLDNSVGWGPNGLEWRGVVRITPKELERVERFTSATKYSIALNNCEHFANYVRHGLPYSSQENTWWKGLGTKVINRLQPVQSVSANYNSLMNEQIAEVLRENLRQAKIEKADRERIEFWRSRGFKVK